MKEVIRDFAKELKEIKRIINKMYGVVTEKQNESNTISELLMEMHDIVEEGIDNIRYIVEEIVESIRENLERQEYDNIADTFRYLARHPEFKALGRLANEIDKVLDVLYDIGWEPEE